MKRISISEHQYLTTTDEVRRQIHTMMQELAHDSGIDWQLEYRWATITEENYFLALLKYGTIIQQFKVN